MLCIVRRWWQAACGVSAGVLALAISGCAVGPTFVAAPAPEADGYVRGKLASPDPGRGGPPVAGQHFVTGADVSARWWSAFKSPPLNQLVRRSVDHNPNLQAAEAAIKVARYNALAQRGLYFPQISGSSNGSDSLFANPGQLPQIPTAGPQSQFTLVTNQLTVSFVPDVWGANFRGFENLDTGRGKKCFQLKAPFSAPPTNA